jgi:hypothetical protein
MTHHSGAGMRGRETRTGRARRYGWTADRGRRGRQGAPGPAAAAGRSRRRRKRRLQT